MFRLMFGQNPALNQAQEVVATGLSWPVIDGDYENVAPGLDAGALIARDAEDVGAKDRG